MVIKPVKVRLQPLWSPADSLRAACTLFGFALPALSAEPLALPSLFVAARRWLLIPRFSFVVAGLR